MEFNSKMILKHTRLCRHIHTADSYRMWPEWCKGDTWYEDGEINLLCGLNKYCKDISINLDTRIMDKDLTEEPDEEEF